MKKTLLKLGFIVFCIGAAIFLLLPFLETSGPVNSSLNNGQASVSTDNPLNIIAKRLASLFGRKEKAKQTLPGQNNPSENPLMASTSPAENTLRLPSSVTATQEGADASSRVIQIPTQNESATYEGASFQTDDGEWVLIQQTAPQHSAPGMHEVNVHDNPYDRYVRQERAKHFTPQAPKQEIPDSKWARLIQPIKTFFGFKAPVPVGPSKVTGSKNDEQLAALAISNDKLSHASPAPSAGAMRVPLPNMSLQQWLSFTPQEREALLQQQAIRDFSDMVTGNRAAKEAAEIEADIKFPFPKNSEEQQKKEDYIRERTAANMEIIRQKVRDSILANTEQSKETDELSYMIGCHDYSLPKTESACSLESPQSEEMDKLQQASVQNEQTFFNKTEFVMPKGLPFTVIIGPTGEETFQLTEDLNPALKPTLDIYNSMYEQQKCGSTTCFWLPNKKQSDPQLKDTFTTIGDAKLVGDPYNNYATFEEPFVQGEIQKKKAENPDATPAQVKQWEQEARKQWKENPPNWVPYTEDQLKQLHQDNTAFFTTAQQGPTDKQPVFPVVTDNYVAREMVDIMGPLGFVYNRTTLVGTQDPYNAGEQLTQSIADDINDTKQAIQSVYQGVISQTARDAFNSTTTAVNNQGGGINPLFDALKSGFQGGAPKK